MVLAVSVHAGWKPDFCRMERAGLPGRFLRPSVDTLPLEMASSLSLRLALESGGKSRFSIPKGLGAGQGVVALCPRQQAGMIRPHWFTHRRVFMHVFSCGYIHTQVHI